MNEILNTVEGIAGLIITAAGFIAWLTKLHYDVSKNRELRHEDKKDILKEVKHLENRINSVEAQNINATTIFSEIKERLAGIEAKIELFLTRQ